MTRSAGNLIGCRLIRNGGAVRWTAAAVENAEGPDMETGLFQDPDVRKDRGRKVGLVSSFQVYRVSFLGT